LIFEPIILLDNDLNQKNIYLEEKMKEEINSFTAGIHGNKLYQERARKALPILVEYAKHGKSVTYSDLAEKLEMPNARNLNYVLGAIGNSLERLSTRIKFDIPLINCLVINKETGLPGSGVFDFWLTNKEEFEKLSISEQIDKIDKYHNTIFSFKKWDVVLANLELDEYIYFDLENNVEALLEGGNREHIAKIMKRNPRARLECIAHYGTNCQVCGFNFNEYDKIGDGYIQVHHNELLSEKDEEYVIDPVEDLIPVCANCHVMLHQQRPPYTVEQLKEVLYGEK
jgi:hypothetical protein